MFNLSIPINGRGFKTLSLVTSFVFYIIFSSSFAQNTDQALTVSMNTGWQENNPMVSDFVVGSYVPITAFLNRNAYVYLFEIRPNGAVRLNFPSNLADYDPQTTGNVIWGGEGQSFVRFVGTGSDVGLWNYVLVASLEPLSKDELARLNTSQSLGDLNLSTEWYVAVKQQAQVGSTGSFAQQQKEDSSLWPIFTYVRDNNLLNY